MKYTKQAERIMENGGSPADWYNRMSSGFYDFYEQVWGLVYNALLDQGYYMEASAFNGSGVVDVYTADKTGKPVGDSVVTVDMADELSLFFELVASGEYANAKDIAAELTDEYMSLITSGSGPHKAAREAERKATEDWDWFSVEVVIDADTYPDLSRGGYKKKSSEKERIKLLEKFSPVSPVKIVAFYKAPGNWYDELSITGYCPPEIKDQYSWDDWNIIWQTAADKVFAALSDTAGNGVNSSRRYRR